MKPIILMAVLLPCLAAAQVKPDTTTRPATVTGVNAIPSQYYSNIKLNSVRVWEPSKPYRQDSDVIAATRTVGEVKQTTQYFDGLGRPLQTVVKKISPGGKDMVTAVVYDAFGREVFKYLPYIQIGGNTNDGAFKGNPFFIQDSFYKSALYNPGAVGEQVFYSKTMFENSPLMRPDTVFAPGNSWGGNHVGVSMKYTINKVSDSVRIWNIDMDRDDVPVTYAKYAAGELYKTITTDENGKQVIEYKDKEGQVILKKVQLASSPSTHHTGWLCTYYVYDDFGNLRFVIPPKAVESIAGTWTITTTIKNELCFRYEYDERRRMIIKKVPGAGEVHMVYDQKDRLILTQDANQRVNDDWLIMNYDDLNRPKSTYKISWGYMREDWQLEAYEDIDYPSQYFLDSYAELLTQSYYDDYSWVSGSGSGLSSSLITTYTANTNYFYTGSSSAPYPQAINATNVTWGMPTGSKVKVLGTSTFLYSTTFYDDRGRAIQTHSTNYSGGKDTATMQYDFTGKVLRTLVCHAKSGTNSQRHIILTKNEYDDAGRLTTLKKKTNNSPEVTIASNTYDELGQLKQKKIGRKRDETNQNTYTSTPLDSLAYTYNIRGWLRGINKDYARGVSGANNWFGMELSYDVGFSQDQLNGNIAGIRWKSNGSDEQRSYGFSYDAVNRLLKADFTQKSGSNWNTTAGIDFSMKMGDGSDPTSAYDANGNILKMWQKGLKISASATIDSLNYAYQTSSNKLAKVTDGITTDNKLGDFNDVNTAYDDYIYDANGNMTYDRNKSISAIIYNHLNLPDSIRVLGKGTIKYTYDAAGNKLQKKTVDSTVSGTRTTITKYLGGFVFQNDTLQYAAQEEGRIREKRVNGQDTMYYDYFIKDHLGNVRMMLTDEKKTDAYLETNEDEYAMVENALFINRENISTNITTKPSCFDSNDENSKVEKITSADDDESAGMVKTVVGSGKLLKVMAGDHVSASVFGWYDKDESTNNPGSTTALSTVLASLLTGGIQQTVSKGNLGSLTTSEISPVIDEFLVNQDNYNAGNAYLNYILLDDETFKLVESGFVSLMDVHGGTCEEQKSLLQINEGEGLTIGRNGYLFIYLSNTSTDYPVYFDDLKIDHVRGPLLEETHYYPFGLTMAGISSKAANGVPENRKKFNDGSELASKDFSDGSGLELYETTFRRYDPQLGRFHQIDLLANFSMDITPFAYGNNNPLLFNDPTGLIGDSTGKNGEVWHGIKEDVVVTSKGKKLEGGNYSGLWFSEIATWSRSGWGSFNIQTKEKLTNEKILLSFEKSINFEKNLSKLFGTIGKLSGGISPTEVLAIKDVKEAWKAIKSGKIGPRAVLLLAAASCMIIESEKHQDNEEKLTEIMNNYIGLHSSAITTNPTEAKGVYTISSASGSGGTGGAGVIYQTSYYDVATKKFLGMIKGSN